MPRAVESVREREAVEEGRHAPAVPGSVVGRGLPHGTPIGRAFVLSDLEPKEGTQQTQEAISISTESHKEVDGRIVDHFVFSFRVFYI